MSQKFNNDLPLMFADENNSTPRKRLGYRTVEELFEEQFDSFYAI